MPRRPTLRLILPLVLSLMTSAAWAGTSAPDQPDTAGAYLAAHLAASSNDFAAAATWFDKALLADPTNPGLLDGAVAVDLALGDIDSAARNARALIATGSKSQNAYLAILAAHAKAGDFAAILADQKAGNSIGSVADRLVTAWAEVGTGKMSDAIADFQKLAGTQGIEPFGLYHEALALASTGDYEGADKLFSDPKAEGITGLRRAVVAHVEILSQLERAPDAIALIDKVYGTQMDEGFVDLRRRLVAGEPIPFDAARTASDGMAEVFFTLATALADQADDTFTLINARIAAALRPDHVEAQLMAARILQKLGQFDLATAAFSTIPPTDAAYVSAVIGAANAALSGGNGDQAVALMQGLSTLKPTDIDVQSAYGDSLQRHQQCDLAIKAFDAALALVAQPGRDYWPLFYKRGSCKQQAGDWPGAEADYKTALAFAPNEPRLLNELGYSYVDRGEHLDEALAMIQKAVAASPDAGYIVDSLAWAYFRLGRYADAVAPQEKASLLMPVDAVVTDHLGDVYWMVGRKREAQFQWHRALSFKPADKDAVRIRHKLDVGLDVVLAEEKAAGTNGN